MGRKKKTVIKKNTQKVFDGMAKSIDKIKKRKEEGQMAHFRYIQNNGEQK